MNCVQERKLTEATRTRGKGKDRKEMEGSRKKRIGKKEENGN